MSPRTFGYLMLLFCSAMAGAGYARLAAVPPDQRTVTVADVAAVQPDTQPGQGATVQTNAGPDARAPERSQPAIRVILPSPYEVRTN
jgi:hypothetical protein